MSDHRVTFPKLFSKALKDLLNHAKENGYAIPAVNCNFAWVRKRLWEEDLWFFWAFSKVLTGGFFGFRRFPKVPFSYLPNFSFGWKSCRNSNQTGPEPKPKPNRSNEPQTQSDKLRLRRQQLFHQRLHRSGQEDGRSGPSGTVFRCLGRQFWGGIVLVGRFRNGTGLFGVLFLVGECECLLLPAGVDFLEGVGSSWWNFCVFRKGGDCFVSI